MGQSTADFRAGFKVEVDGQPWLIVSVEFVKPGKGQAFNRVKLKNLITGRQIERTYKSGDKLELADVAETNMRFLYKDVSGAVFMCDESFEQLTLPLEKVGDVEQWLMEDQTYGLVFYKGEPIALEPPTFMELKITESAPAIKGDTASGGRMVKPAVVETGATVQVPIFLEEGETIKVDTRTGEYVSRVNK